VFRAVAFCVGTLGWPTGCSGVGFGIGIEGASSGSAGLVAFWLFCMVNFLWSGFRCRIFSSVRFGDFGPCVEHTLCGCGWMFVLSSSMVMSLWELLCLIVCVAGVTMREGWAGLLLPGGQRRKDR